MKRHFLLALSLLALACACKQENTAKPSPEEAPASAPEPTGPEAKLREPGQKDETDDATRSAAYIAKRVKPVKMMRVLGGDEPTGGDLGAAFDEASDKEEKNKETAPTSTRGELEIGAVAATRPSSLSAGKVGEVITRRYARGLRACYQRLLRSAPTAQGSVTLGLGVTGAGRVENVTIKAFDSSIEACVKPMVQGWRFPAPKSETGAPTAANFRVPLIFRVATASQ